MVKNKKLIQNTIFKFIDSYLSMNILGHKLSCPYWSNKLKNGKVVLRGFQNGKGDAESIRNELEKLLLKDSQRKNILLDPEKFRKFAKRNRIGIDCSGLVFRILDKIVGLSGIFNLGINKTDSKTLTSQVYCRKIQFLGEAKILDMIRINNSRHVALITDVTEDIITYIHSASRLTSKQGVHIGKIKLIDKSKLLENQDFQEKTKNGENFGRKYIHVQQGDGIYRLK